MSPAHKTLVLFDFDGTLTRGDSFGRFLLFSVGFSGVLIKIPSLIWRLGKLVLLGNFSKDSAKELVWGHFFAGKNETALRALGSDFAEKCISTYLNDKIIADLRRYQSSGASVWIVSASIDVWLAPFATKEGTGLLCTEAAFFEGNATGRFASPNCNRVEKARRIREAINLAAFDRIIAYGNSSGDAAMFELAHEVYVVKN